MKKLTLYTGIYSYTAEYFVDKLLEIDENEDVEVLINSPGGSVFAGWSIIGPLRDRPGKVNAKVFGDASSMALFALLFMNKVSALDVSTFLLHRADGYVEDDEDQKFLDQVNKDLRAKLEKKIDQEAFTKITGKTLDDVFDPKQRLSINLTAKEAKKIGLVDEIIRLDPVEMEALAHRFVAFYEPQGSGDKNNGQGSSIENESINQKITKMTKEEFKAANLEAYNAILAEGQAIERDRVQAILEYGDIDFNACKTLVDEGKNPTQKFFAEMNRKAISAKQLNDQQNDAPEAQNLDTNAGKEGTKTPDQLKAEKEAADFEIEAMRSAGINVTSK